MTIKSVVLYNCYQQFSGKSGTGGMLRSFLPSSPHPFSPFSWVGAPAEIEFGAH